MGRANLADIEGKDFRGLGKETNTNTEELNKVSNMNTSRNRNTTSSDSRGRMTRRRNRRMTVRMVQRLFETCKDVFALAGTGIVPTPDKIEQLRAVLDNIQPADVGLNPRMPSFRPQVTGQAPKITYLHIHECKKFSMGIFCLPPSGVLPLHNHPGMTVFSKLLFGTMHIKSYDWVVDVPSNAAAVVDPLQNACYAFRKLRDFGGIKEASSLMHTEKNYLNIPFFFQQYNLLELGWLKLRSMPTLLLLARPLYFIQPMEATCIASLP